MMAEKKRGKRNREEKKTVKKRLLQKKILLLLPTKYDQKDTKSHTTLERMSLPQKMVRKFVLPMKTT